MTSWPITPFMYGHLRWFLGWRGGSFVAKVDFNQSKQFSRHQTFLEF